MDFLLGVMLGGPGPAGRRDRRMSVRRKEEGSAVWNDKFHFLVLYFVDNDSLIENKKCGF